VWKAGREVSLSHERQKRNARSLGAVGSETEGKRGRVVISTHLDRENSWKDSPEQGEGALEGGKSLGGGMCWVGVFLRVFRKKGGVAR